MITNKIPIKIFCDGGARGNPGPAASAFVIEIADKIIYKGSKFLGKATNNVAEYTALIMALFWLKQNKEDLPPSKALIYLDSELVVKQMSGVFKIKNENLRNLYLQAKTTEKNIGGEIKYLSISREKNKLADFLVNKTLDENR